MLDELKQARLEKLERIRNAGINPYPSKSERTLTVAEALRDFDVLSESKDIVTVAGRLRTLREHGALTFADLEDQSGRLQLFFQKDTLGDARYSFLKNVDMGDFIEAKGFLFTTNKGQKTLNAGEFKILTKSLLPLPEKWHGLTDEETRYRKRYLDLIMNEDVRELFRKRTAFIGSIREFLNAKGFMEVETPVLESVPGGAEAEPFITHHNKLDIDFYLRISLELHLKRLMVGGFEKIYEIGRVFRNEGISTQHLQEFTMLEFYWAYADYEKLMDFVEDFYTTIIGKTFGTLDIPYKGEILHFQRPWPRIDYREVIIRESGIDIDQYPTKEAMQELVKNKGIKPDPAAGRGRLIDQLYKKLVRPNLMQPCFLINHPIDISPLAKSKEDDANKVERLQVLIAGAEVGNGFSELNDPIDQRSRFLKQEELRRAGDKEAQMIDEDFVEALEYGMPPTAGFGVGIDRLLMILADQENIRDVVFFPMMKPKPAEEVGSELLGMNASGNISSAPEAEN
jgi:lysyl-tRNA synthetase class 2